ncbi:MAG: CU044_2847 family protein [Nostoc sp.]|uniref:CU044_2847 family protein n=1 Tax=Nostoc sp. TaxID=1180 RepID=UPI002FF99833
MAEKQLVEFALEDGTKFFVEVEKPAGQTGIPPKPVSRDGDLAVTPASKTFDKALNDIKPVLATVVSKLKDISPNETEVKFGLKLAANAGVIFTSLGSELTFEITVKWSKE